jgi:nucleotide-binding universal stress UspA family protein
MLSFKKILCPIDFSDPSNKALSVACELATHYEAQLLVLHVLQSIQPIYGETVLPELMAFNVEDYEKTEKENLLRSLCELIKAKVPSSTTAMPIVEVGSTADTIVDTAKRENVDLIVVATHGLTGWRHHVLGSVTEKVVRLAHYPVLTIRQSTGEAK